MKNKKILITTSIISFLLFIVVYIFIQNRGEDCTPYNLQIDRTEKETYISWISKSKCSSFVKYGLSVNDISKKITPLISNSMLNTRYEVKVNKNDIEYFYLVINDENYYLNGKIINVD